MSDQLLDSNTTALITASDAKTMALWADDKKRDFIGTFEKRVEVATFIVYQTAAELTNAALERRFISRKHLNSIKTTSPTNKSHRGYYYQGDLIGGRSYDELFKIAKERAADIIKKLPALKDAVKIIDAETFKLIEEHKELKDKLTAKNEKLMELSEPVVMADLDQSMTLKEFQAYVKKLHADKAKLQSEIYADGRELQERDITISKRLYAGLPGISEAIISVINEHYERITGLEATCRRVAERVSFGDSPEALSLLEHFEKDELTISDKIQAEFDTALAKLNLSKKTKKLTAKK
jgi:hypothetical protein